MILRHVVDIDTDDAVAEALVEHRSYIRAVARRLAKGDRPLASDIEQEAAIRLWEMDPTRFDASDRHYIRAALFKRMLQAARSERRASGGENRLSLSV